MGVAEQFVGLRNQLVNGGWSPDGAEELIITMIANQAE